MCPSGRWRKTRCWSSSFPWAPAALGRTWSESGKASANPYEGLHRVSFWSRGPGWEWDKPAACMIENPRVLKKKKMCVCVCVRACMHVCVCVCTCACSMHVCVHACCMHVWSNLRDKHDVYPHTHTTFYPKYSHHYNFTMVKVSLFYWCCCVCCIVLFNFMYLFMFYFFMSPPWPQQNCPLWDD